MKLQSEFIKEHYPSAAKTSPPPDFVRIAYLEYVVDEILKRPYLEPKPPTRTLNEERGIEWPASPPVCSCGGNKERDIVCPDCGGLLF